MALGPQPFGLNQAANNKAKIEDHSESRFYEANEIVIKDNKQYRANSDINGTETPIPFSEGAGVNEWTEVSKGMLDDDFTLSETALTPNETRTMELGNAENSFKRVTTESVNFVDENGTASGNIDADSSSNTQGLGVWGDDVGLHLGRTNNSPDLSFEDDSIEVKKDLLVKSGASLSFEDTDSTGKEVVRLKAGNNSINFHSVTSEGVESTEPVASIDYFGRAEFNGRRGSQRVALNLTHDDQEIIDDNYVRIYTSWNATSEDLELRCTNNYDSNRTLSVMSQTDADYRHIDRQSGFYMTITSKISQTNFQVYKVLSTGPESTNSDTLNDVALYDVIISPSGSTSRPVDISVFRVG